MKDHLNKAFTFDEYVELIDRLLLEGKTTGPVQSDEMLHYARLNRQRMRRLTNTIALTEPLREAAQNVRRKMIWLIITEGWCGDAAQNIPVIEMIAKAGDNIETKYLLRDENLGLMDQYLTSGARAIPKLIAIDAETYEVLGTWGARPAAAQKLYDSLKAQNMAKPLIMENLQRWYNSDATRSLQEEFRELIARWDRPKQSASASKA
jgi:hypothetical protein